VEAVLFDWDGTLVDTLGGLFRANVAVFGKFELPFDEALYRRHYAPDWREMYRRLGIPDERLDEAATHWLAAFDPEAAPPFPGVTGALGRLRGAGYRLGVVTAGERRFVEPQLARTGIGPLLETVVYGDDLAVHKPDPAPLRKALGDLGLADAPKAATFVGDAPSDMRMASAVGVPAVGIASILGAPDELLAAGAAEVADSVSVWVDSVIGVGRPSRASRHAHR
jgi:HAD superfamily hydrolase (TIGR01509 family)